MGDFRKTESSNLIVCWNEAGRIPEAGVILYLNMLYVHKGDNNTSFPGGNIIYWNFEIFMHQNGQIKFLTIQHELYKLWSLCHVVIPTIL